MALPFAGLRYLQYLFEHTGSCWIWIGFMRWRGEATELLCTHNIHASQLQVHMSILMHCHFTCEHDANKFREVLLCWFQFIFTSSEDPARSAKNESETRGKGKMKHVAR